MEEQMQQIAKMQNSMMCPLHEHSEIDVLCLNIEDERVLKCSFCVNEEYLKPSRSIPLNLIRGMKDETIIANFPIEDTNLTHRLFKLVAQSTSVIRDQIDIFFKEFRSVFLDKIHSLQEDMVARVLQINDLREIAINQYSEIINKKALQNILADSEKSIEEKDKNFKQILTEIKENEAKNKSLLLKQLDFLSQLNEGLEFSRDYLIGMKDNMSTWMNQLQQLIKDNGKEETEVNLSQIQQKSSHLLDFVGNITNDIPNESFQKLREEIEQMKFAFTFTFIPKPGKAVQHLQSITQKDDQFILKSVVDSMNKSLPLSHLFQKGLSLKISEDLLIPVDLNFQSAKFEGSPEMKIEKENEGFSISIPDSGSGYVFSDILNKDKTYHFQLKITKPQDESSAYFSIGLIDDTQINKSNSAQSIEQIFHAYDVPRITEILKWQLNLPQAAPNNQGTFGASLKSQNLLQNNIGGLFGASPVSLSSQSLFQPQVQFALATQDAKVIKGSKIINEIPQNGFENLDLKFNVANNLVYLSNKLLFSPSVNQIQLSSNYKPNSQYRFGIFMMKNWKITITKCVEIHPTKLV